MLTQCDILMQKNALNDLRLKFIVFLVVYEGFVGRLKKSIFRLVRNLPFVRGMIASEMGKQRHSMEESFHKSAKGETYVEKLPAKGLSEVSF